jgi:hypothetical protein
MNWSVAFLLIESGLHKAQYNRIPDIRTCAELNVGLFCNDRMAVMDQQTAADISENDPAALRGDNREPKVPCRCKDCPDSVLCDFDYCLHWWH